MNSSDIPSRIIKPFGLNGLKNAIPVDSSTSTDNNGVATFDKGFPPITMQPLSAGGIPPSGKDMNGVIYSVTLQQQWQNAGAGYTFSQDFSDAVGGYPKGSVVANSTLNGQWISLNEANATPPESATGATTGWVPINNYGITSITLAATSVVMSSIQAAKDRIILTGVLTANVNLIFPTWIKSWVVQNNCTGNFSVTCKTASGTGVIVIPGMVSRLFCDGTNITDETMSTTSDFVGSVTPFAMNSAPAGWLAADGTAVSRNIYARLFSRIGTLYGPGDGTTTFNLPDLRGDFVRGIDNGRTADPSRVFGSWQPGTIVGGYDDDNTGANIGLLIGHGTNKYGSDPVDLANYGLSAVYFTAGVSLATSPVENAPYFYSVTRPRNIALLYCIKF
ncbi:tail fiber protein [Escherichia coli]|uniref:phage tail protein n=1 Tax=Escherichia coli TaxID=562 RepID=UPI00215AB9CF|nr:phage tail protein [Escherichia coli]UVE62939.1 tail fiber protein [Escherichia coli]